MGDPTAAIGNNPMKTTKQHQKHIVATLNQSRTDKKKKSAESRRIYCA